MKTLLDLIQEFAALNDAKTLGGGILPPGDEKRWQELKEFYDLLMAQEGFCEHPAARFTTDEIRQRVSARIRLRVATDMDVIIQHQSDYLSARLGNLSRGGALLLSDTLFEKGSRLTLHLTRIDQRKGLLLTDGDVVWHTNKGPTESQSLHRMGIQFVGLEKDDRDKLDAFIIESIETRLLSLPPHALDPDFVRREQLAL
jgi:hypothetical protein